MKIKERLDKLEEKMGTKDKGYLIAHLRTVEEGFSVTVNNEEIGIFSTKEEAEKTIDEMAGEKQVLLVELVESVYAKE